MEAPVLTFFTNKGWVGKTSLVYHLAWMLSEIGERVLACDLDPQANLTANFLDEDQLESLWEGNPQNRTIYQCIRPLTEVGDLHSPRVHQVSDTLGLVPGDLALSSFEDSLSSEWSDALGESNLYRPFRILTAFWQIMQMGAEAMDATIILVDVGPNLEALNRSALIATDYVIAPLGADLFSLQGLKNLGTTLQRWNSVWSTRRKNWQTPGFSLPRGSMKPTGYIVQQHDVRLKRPVKAYDKWANRMPAAYHEYLLQQHGPYPDKPENDADCLATIRHYRSLVPMGQESRKPVFHLRSADGAIGAHAEAVGRAYDDFETLANKIRRNIGLTA